MTGRQFTMALAGLGRAATSFLPALRAHPDVAVVAGADPRGEARERLAGEFSAEVYEDAFEMLSQTGSDGVYIATPHHLHADLCVAAAEAGKHILVEKPMALTMEDCDRVVAAVEKAGVQLVVGPTHGFDEPVAQMRAIIDEGAVGKVQALHSFNYKNFMYIPLARHEIDPGMGGGVVFNQGPHQIDMMRALVGGRAVSIRAVTGISDPRREVEGWYQALVSFDSGAAATLIFNGYGRFDSDEFNDWVGEGGARKEPGRSSPEKGAVLAALRNGDDEGGLKASTGYGGSKERPIARRHRAGHSHFGVTVVSCEHADLRTVPNGVMVYDDDGQHLVEVPVPSVGKMPALEELRAAAAEDRKPMHDARWGRATAEIALAIHESARRGQQIHLSSH